MNKPPLKKGPSKPSTNGALKSDEEKRIEAATRDTKNNLNRKVKDVATAAKYVAPGEIPKGNVIEEEMKAAAATGGEAIPPKNKATTGQPKGQDILEPEVEEIPPVAEPDNRTDEDAIATMVNGLVIMPLSKITHQDYHKFKLSPDQKKELLLNMPDSGLGKRTWGKYIFTMLGMIGENYGQMMPDATAPGSQAPRTSNGLTPDDLMNKMMDVALQLKSSMDDLATKVNSTIASQEKFNQELKDLKTKFEKEVTNGSAD